MTSSQTNIIFDYLSDGLVNEGDRLADAIKSLAELDILPNAINWPSCRQVAGEAREQTIPHAFNAAQLNQLRNENSCVYASLVTSESNAPNATSAVQLVLLGAFFKSIELSDGQKRRCCNLLHQLYAAHNNSFANRSTQTHHVEDYFPEKITLESVQLAIQDIADIPITVLTASKKYEAKLVLRKLGELLLNDLVMDTPKDLGLFSADADVAELPADTPQEQVASLSQHFHRMRFTNMIAERSPEALPFLKSRDAIKLLLEYTPNTPELGAARLIWVLCAITGRPFDALLASAMGREHDGRFTLSAQNDVLTLKAEHPLDSCFLVASPNPELSQTLEITYDFEKMNWFRAAWSYIEKQTNEKKLLSAKEDIRSHLRAHFHDVTADRLRCAIVQAIYGVALDKPATQILTGESLLTSSAALHYIVFSRNYLTSMLQSALMKACGDIDIKVDIKSEKFGVPLADSSNEIIHPLSAWVSSKLKQANQLKHPSLRLKRHQKIAEAVLVIVGVTSTHRMNRSLLTLTVNDVFLPENLIFHRDKRSNPSLYRRLSVLPSGARQHLEGYIAHLHTLAELVSPKDRALAQKAQSALAGTAPLFFSAPGEPALNPRALTRTAFGDKLEHNQGRHYLASKLRELGAPPLGIEANLGHDSAIEVFGLLGSSSPVQFSSEMLPYLDQAFEQLNAKPLNPKKSSQRRNYIHHNELQKLSEDEAEADRKLFWGEEQATFKYTKKQKDEIILGAIQEVRPDILDPDVQGSTVSKKEVTKIQWVAHAKCKGNFELLINVNLRLRKRVIPRNNGQLS